jgi:hypothetical protein
MGAAMACRRLSRLVAGALVGVQCLACVAAASAASPEEIEQKLKSLQEQMNDLKKQLEQTKTPAPVSPPPPAASPAGAESIPTSKPNWLSDFRLGGYGSTRFEASDL